MGSFVRLEMPRGSSRPWVGTVRNRDTGGPVDLRQPDTTIVLTVKQHETDPEPLVAKSYDSNDPAAGDITVDPADPGNVYTIEWAPEDTADIEAEQLMFAVSVVEPDDEGDVPVHGVLALTST